jgi:biopolymer transport protein ExbD
LPAPAGGVTKDSAREKTMARKERKRTKPNYDLDINMTPMIDVVFNLIIFFMVITDMTQKDLEYLTLPRAEHATPDEGEDKDRIIINVIDLDTKVNREKVERGELSRSLPPILMQGQQIKDLDQMRMRLLQLANPRRFPDLTKGEVHPQLAPGLYPSKKPLLVRCDQGQIFGWVQAIMQYCTFIPGRPPADELKKSPLIYKLEIAVAEPEQQ